MKSLVCDICKRAIQTPVKERNYFHVENRDICEPCKDAVEASIKPVMRSKHPFNYEWYERVLMDTIEKAVAKGKV
jgi:hypothetical protein